MKPTQEQTGTALELTYFVGNANGRGLIRLEVAGTGEHVASMPRGQKSQVFAGLITERFNGYLSLHAQTTAQAGVIKELVAALEENTQALAFMAGAFSDRLRPEHKERNQSAFKQARAALLLAQKERGK